MAVVSDRHKINYTKGDIGHTSERNDKTSTLVATQSSVTHSYNFLVVLLFGLSKVPMELQSYHKLVNLRN